MTPDYIRHAWEAAFPHTAPAGFLCRPAAPERWVRIHGLPEGKRYADSEIERLEILRRHNEAAHEILGQDSNCVLFTAQFGDRRLWKTDQQGPLGELVLVHVMAHGKEDDAVQFFAAEVNWQAGAFDLLLGTVADDETGSVLFFNPARQTAFAPYDGGADLFLRSAEEACGIKRIFRTWLSDRPDGL